MIIKIQNFHTTTNLAISKYQPLRVVSLSIHMTHNHVLLRWTLSFSNVFGRLFAHLQLLTLTIIVIRLLSRCTVPLKMLQGPVAIYPTLLSHCPSVKIQIVRFSSSINVPHCRLLWLTSDANNIFSTNSTGNFIFYLPSPSLHSNQIMHLLQ